MYISLATIAVSLLLGTQSVTALPRGNEDGPGRGRANGNGNGRGNGGQQNQQLAQILQGTGIRQMSVNQLNKLIQNLGAAGVTLGCEAAAGNETGVVVPPAEGGAAAGEGEAAAGEG